MTNYSTATPSTVATLSGLVVTGGGSDLVTFVSGTTTYTASVANAVAEVTVRATTTDSEATIDYLDGSDRTLTDAGAADGHQVTLAVGDTVIKVKVTAQDALMTTTYTVTVNRAASTDATLSGLTVTGGGSDLVTFASGTTTYTASVANAVAEVTVTAMTTDSEATIDYLDGSDRTLTDAGTADGHQVTLAEGDNVIKVKVTAADPTSTETYTVTVTRAASMDATLSGLTVTGGGSDLVTFVSGTTTYTASVANAVAEVTVTATTTDSEATIDYLDGSDRTLTDAGTADGHQVTLAEGDNVIKVKVTAADPTSTETYTVTVTRAASMDAMLSGLTVTGGGSDLVTLVSGTTTYTASVANAVAEVTVTATTTDSGAMIDYLDGSDMTLTDAGTADGHQVTLAEGDNVIKVKVTAADGNNTETYTVTVNRAASDTTAPTLTSARAGRTLMFLVFSEDLVVRVGGGGSLRRCW